jgi:HEAT repeat protein
MNSEPRLRLPSRVGFLPLALFLSTLLDTTLAGYEIKLFPASTVYTPDLEVLHERLGFNGQKLKAEDFEEAEPADWVRTNLKGTAQDTARAAWRGRSASTSAENAHIEIRLPGARLVGIGVADNDGGREKLTINGGMPIQLNKLEGHCIDSGGRAYFVTIEAEPGDADIATLHFDEGLTVVFDYLIVQQSGIPENTPEKQMPRLVLDLTDGSRLVGEFADTSIPFSMPQLKLDLPLDRVSSMQFQNGRKAATLLLKNGEKLSGEVGIESIKVSSILGELVIPLEKIRLIRVSFRNARNPSAAVQLPQPRHIFHSDEPSFGNKKLRAWLQDCGPRPRAGRAFDSVMPGADSESAEQQQAKAAIRQIGSAAIPFLMEMLRRGATDARQAVYGFAALGQSGWHAVEELMQLLDETEEAVHDSAILALGHIGLAAQNTIPRLLDEAKAGNLAAMESLGNMGQAAAAAVPLIIAKLKKRDLPTDTALIVALGRIGSNTAVPVLREIVESDLLRAANRNNITSLQRRQTAVTALGLIGRKNEEVAPFLIELLEKEPNVNVLDMYFKYTVIDALGTMGSAASAAAPLLRAISQNERLKSYRLQQPAAAALRKITEALEK